MGESVWVLGASMTKIGRYPDKDVIDLAAEATFDALDDAGVTIFDMDVMRRGRHVQQGGIGQRVAKQVGQTGIPIYNVVNACATGATAVRTAYIEIRRGDADFGLAIGAEQMGKMGLLRQRRARGANKSRARGRYGGVMPVDGWLGTGTMPAVFGQAGMEYAYENDGVGFEQFAKVAQKNHDALRR